MKIIKSNTYNFINAEPFDIPFPMQFELYSANTLLVEYNISDEGVVNYSFNPNTNEKILTSTKRALELKDVYFLFLSRTVPEHSPYVRYELEKYELEEYNPYEIIRRSHAIVQGDNYWIRFSDQDLNYKKALKEFQEINEKSYKRLFETQKAYVEQMKNPEPISINNDEVENILHQKDINFNNLSHDILDRHEPVYETKREFNNDVPDEVNNSEISDEDFSDIMKKFEERIESNDENDSSSTESGGMMSDDAIAAMLAAANGGMEAEKTAEPEPNAKMSDDAIAAMLAAANGSAEAEKPAEPDPNAKMSDDAIAAMLAAANGGAEAEKPAEPEPAANPNAKMSDDAIAAMLAAANGGTETEKPSEPEPAANPNAKMSDDAIAAMLAAANGGTEAEKPAEPEPAANSNAKMSDDAIAAMLAAANGGAETEKPAEPDPNAKMSDDAIAAMFANTGN